MPAIPLMSDMAKAIQEAVQKVLQPEQISGTSLSTDTFVFPFPKTYIATPLVVPITTISGDIEIVPEILSITATGCTLRIKQSRPAIVVALGAFVTAPKGTPFTLLVFGIKSTP